MFFVLPLRDNAPGPRMPYATLALIAANVLAYLYELSAPGGPQAVIAHWGLTPAKADPATLLTATYLHFSPGHLLGNMLILWLLGDALEWLCGPWRFLLFYTLCGVVSSFVLWLIGGSSEQTGAGASGAIAGVMGAYLLHFPRARITSWVMIWFVWPIYSGLRNISALWFIGGWIAQQLCYSLLAARLLEPGPYGVFAHSAGALVGMGLIYVLRSSERVPDADHPLRSGRLSTVLIGDAGDGGDGRPPPLDPREQQAIRRLRAMQTPFDDRAVRSLMAQGDWNGATACCELMLEQAEADFNDKRIIGYRSLLQEIETARRLHAG